MNALKLLLGGLLLLLAVKQWRQRPRSGEWPRCRSGCSPWITSLPDRAAALGVALSAANPKNLLLVVGAAAAIAQTGASAGAQAAALAIFTLITSLGPRSRSPSTSRSASDRRQTLDSIQDWMRQNNAAIMTVVCLVIGVKLIGDAISGFAG